MLKLLLLLLCCPLTFGEQYIRVLSQNIWGLRISGAVLVEERVRAFATHIKESDYDVVLLQEVWYKRDYELLSNITSSAYNITDFYSLSGCCCDGVHTPVGCSGLVILSKFPIHSTNFKPFSERGSLLSFDGEILVNKGVASARISVTSDLSIDVLNTHTAAFGYNSYYREIQVSEIVREVQKSDAAFVILGGDLNYDLRQGNETSYEALMKIMKDTYVPPTSNTSSSSKRSSSDADEMAPLSEISIGQEADNRRVELDNGLDRATSHLPTNVFSEPGPPMILDYMLYKVNRSRSKLDFHVQQWQIESITEEVLSGYSEEKCRNLFHLPDTDELVSDASEGDAVHLIHDNRHVPSTDSSKRNEALDYICKHTNTSRISLSDHEGVDVTFVISSPPSVLASTHKERRSLNKHP